MTRTLRCALYGKPFDADRLDKADLLLWADVPEFLRVKTVEQDAETWGPWDWWYTTALPWLLDRNKIACGRWLFTVTYPGEKPFKVLSIDEHQDEKPTIIGDQMKLI